jgi:cellulose synthase/poly-beta-1,6-N-acetylglucosamine synthase-like glycosyltransferase
MSSRISECAFILSTVILYIIFAAPLVGLPLKGLAIVAFGAPYLFGAFGLALDLSELILAAIFPVRSYPTAASIDLNRTRVAVLSLCRDDVDKEALRQLQCFHGADVFILDDSEGTRARNLVDASGFKVVRRASHEGYKAGNLNHWLRLYGEKYCYSLVLDSDSIMTNDALLQLVAYAEHPANSDVGIIQASIVPRAGNHFQTRIGDFAWVRRAVLIRVHAWIGWALSQGHNSLHRIAALREIGGFDTCASCEDTLTSLRMRNFGWRTIIVGTVTFDAEPRNVFAHRRRSVRWARQTLDAILARHGGSDPRLSLLLARHLYSYLLAALWPFMLIPFLLISIRTEQRCCVAGWSAGPSWLAVASISPFLGLLTLLSLRIFFWWRIKRTLKGFFASSALSGAAAVFSSADVFLGLISSLLIRQTQFVPTGIVRKDRLGMVSLWNAMKLSTLARVIALSCYLLAGRRELPLMTIIVLPFIVAPTLILWWYHRDQGNVLP